MLLVCGGGFGEGNRSDGKPLADFGGKTDRKTDMILKLCSTATETFIQADEVSTGRGEHGLIVHVTRGGVEVGRYLLGDNEETDYVRGYIMEGGKTVDRIQP